MANPTSPICDTEVFTIANAASVSDAINIGNRIPAGLFMPAAWTAASVTLQSSLDGTTWADVYDTVGSEMAITGTAGGYMAIPGAELLGIGTHLRLRSGTTGTPVNQGAERLLSLRIGRPTV